MSSSKRGGKPFSSGTTDPLPTRKSTSGVSNPGAVQLSQGFSDMSLDSSNDGGWEVYSRKSKNKAGSRASKPWTSHNSNAKRLSAHSIRGVSVLIFEASAVGYLEAECLSAHFKENGKDREAWDRNRVPFYPGGKRQLYGYLADKRDLDHFNQHAQGKSKLKYDMRSYEEMVVSQMKQMSEDNQQLIWFKDKVAKEQKPLKALEESLGVVTEKLSKTLEENRIVRQRTKMHHEQIKEEMDFLEQFFKDQIQIIHEARDAKEGNFEKIQQEEREKMKNTDKNPCVRGEEVAKLIKVQDKEMEEFEMEREKLIKIHEEKVVEMKMRYGEEEVDLEKEFDAELNQLMEKYTPHRSEGGGSSSSSSHL